MRALIFFAIALLGCSRTTPVEGHDAAATEPKASPVVSHVDHVRRAPTLAAAIALAKPAMKDSVDAIDTGTSELAIWALGSMRWADVAVPKDETSFALAMKDPDEERGKRLCASTRLIQIEAEKGEFGKAYNGLASDTAGNIYRFVAVGSTGDLVAGSSARLCGVVTGKFDYANSAGGVGHAVKIVGMFESAPPTPPKTTATAPAPKTTTTSTVTTTPSAEPTAPPRAASSCDPPYTIDAEGRRAYKPECMR